MNPIRHILGVPDDGPVCTECTDAYRGRPRLTFPPTPVEIRVCGSCGQIRACRRVDSHEWPASVIRPTASEAK